MKNYLGIDYGRVHLGVALSEGYLSTPLVSLTNSKEVLNDILKLVTRHQVTSIIVGLPEGSLAKEVTQFANQLGEYTQIPVVLHPETLSTVEALSSLRASGAKRHKLKNDHVYAACLILDDYLSVLN